MDTISVDKWVGSNMNQWGDREINDEVAQATEAVADAIHNVARKLDREIARGDHLSGAIRRASRAAYDVRGAIRRREDHTIEDLIGTVINILDSAAEGNE